MTVGSVFILIVILAAVTNGLLLMIVGTLNNILNELKGRKR